MSKQPIVKHPGQRLVEIRAKLGLTQVGLSNAIGYARGYIGDIEIRRSLPSKAFCDELASAFGVSSDWLFFGEGESILPREEAARSVPATFDRLSKQHRAVRADAQSDNIHGLDRDEAAVVAKLRTLDSATRLAVVTLVLRLG